jgi:hypothetical protein
VADAGSHLESSASQKICTEAKEGEEELIDALKRTLVGTVDLSEQKKADYILIVGGIGGRAYYYIDAWFQKGGNMVFMKDSKVLYECRQEGQWGVIRADITETFTNEDMIRLSKKESDQVEALQKELEPPAEGEDTPRKHGLGVYI